MLLPLPAAAVRNRSLKFHACLETVRRGFGQPQHLVELASLMYITWFLQRAGYGDLPLAQFHEAEQYMELANRRGAEKGTWLLDNEGYPSFECLLTLHDQQLSAAPAHAIVSAEDELMRFIDGDSPSPLPAMPA
ncbi:hypothetical protein CY652_10090 [Burkholderia sp. WAC0059]|uniref:hypothetical protein n=1 Tax=Burkholderia sp. WAC0059 TaxID=2066022 RepID=UPI000C7F5240|nr:hypothetical protein [Burkholderia sp. WAC0059]PLZ02467.1 hypothetical protein CY652_10090 [Burkholderia sp. WAC0059]